MSLRVLSFVLPFLLFVAVVGVLSEGEEDICSSCHRNECRRLLHCPFGVSLDECGCCEVCNRGLGEQCNEKDKCGDFLSCSQANICACEEEGPVCGTDGNTYLSLCELMKETSFNNSLSVVKRDVCTKGPLIKTPPKDVTKEKGSTLILDCEASGFPVPTLSWELYRTDGSTTKLPSDDPTLVVQVRGGPEKNMATGWVQVMKVTDANAGLFTCIAVNDEGENRASAKVTVA